MVTHGRKKYSDGTEGLKMPCETLCTCQTALVISCEILASIGSLYKFTCSYSLFCSPGGRNHCICTLHFASFSYVPSSLPHIMTFTYSFNT